MPYKKVRTGPDETVTHTPTEEIEFCDVCKLEMQKDVFPRFELSVEHYQQPHYEDANWMTHLMSVCSAKCLSDAALSSRTPVYESRRRFDEVESIKPKIKS